MPCWNNDASTCSELATSESMSATSSDKLDEDAWVDSIVAESAAEATQKLKAVQLPKTGSSFVAPSGNRLHMRVVCPENGADAKAVVLYCHGLNSHCNLRHWDDYFQQLSASGFIVVAVDIMGHGYSEGERCFVPDWHIVFRDLESLLEAFMGVIEPVPGPDQFESGLSKDTLLRARQLPLFVTGSSMGGMISMYMGLCLQANERLSGIFRGAVLGCPALSVDLPHPIVKSLLSNLVVPLFKHHEMPPAVSSSSKSPISWALNLEEPRLKEAAASEIRDCAKRLPGVGLGWHGPMLWGTAGAFSALYTDLEKNMRDVRFPFLILHDPADKVCFISGSEKLMELSPSENKTLQTLDSGGFHSICIVAQDKFVAAQLAWMMKAL